MEAAMKKKQTPPFGNWDIYNGIPVSGEQVFQNDVDLFKVHEPPMACNYHKRTKVAEKKHLHHQVHRKQRVCCPVHEQQKRVPKAVDEDMEITQLGFFSFSSITNQWVLVRRESC